MLQGTCRATREWRALTREVARRWGGGEVSVRRRLSMLRGTLRLYEREGEMRPELNRRGRGKGGAGRLSPMRGDGVGGAANFR
jgi:hypothetical protein